MTRNAMMTAMGPTIAMIGARRRTDSCKRDRPTGTCAVASSSSSMRSPPGLIRSVMTDPHPPGVLPSDEAWRTLLLEGQIRLGMILAGRQHQARPRLDRPVRLLEIQDLINLVGRPLRHPQPH